MYPASLIAYAFVQKGIKENKYVTQMKLQKMVYFAHGYHLAQFGSPLIKEDIEAWKFGPVVPEIYEQYKFYGSRPIVDNDYLFNDQDMVQALRTLDDNARAAIEYTWEATKEVSAIQLSNWTHEEDGPWRKYYYDTSLGMTIENGAIQSYFKKFLSKN